MGRDIFRREACSAVYYIRRAENRLARQLLKLHAKLIHFIPDNIRFLLEIKDAFDGPIEVTEIRFEIEFIGE